MWPGVVFQPVASALERIRRQRDSTPGMLPIRASPIDLITADVELAQGVQDLSAVAPALVTERAEPCMAAIQTLPSERKQRIAGTDLDEIIGSELGQCLHALL